MPLGADVDLAIIEAEELRTAMEAVFAGIVTGAKELTFTEFHSNPDAADPTTKRDVTVRFTARADQVPNALALKLADLVNLTRGTR